MRDQTARTTVRLALPILFILIAAPQAQAQEPTQPPMEQREHVVRRGDTLWDLARTYLNNPFSWRLIFEANRDVVENPHWIYPAERLIIPPLLHRQAREPVGTPLELVVVEEAVVVEEPEATLLTELDLRRPIVPYGEFLAAPWLSQAAEREATGRIARLADPTAAEDRLASTLHPRDLVIVQAPNAQPGDSLMIVRVGRRFEDAGRLVQPMGVLLVDRADGAGVRARVVRQFGDAKVGDLVMPLGSAPVIALGEPEPIEGGPEGRLLHFVDRQALYGTTDIAFISLGRQAGVGIGDEFGVYVPARAPRDGTAAAAPTLVGTVRVIRVGERTSTVRVLGVTSTALRDGLPVRMIRRMP